MGYFGNMSDAKANIREVEVTDSSGLRSATSPVEAGSEHNGVENVPAKETLHVGRLRAGIKTPRTRTDKLTRKYAAS